MRLLFLILALSFAHLCFSQKFIEVDGIQFKQHNDPYFYVGVNFWFGMNLGVDGSAGNRSRLIRELDHLEQLGITNLRIMGASEGPDSEPFRVVPSLQPKAGEYNEEVFKGLDFLLSEMKKRNMVAVICLNNFWMWTGGMSQYISWVEGEPIPYSPPARDGDWHTFQQYSNNFFSHKKANDLFREFLTEILQRKNTLTKVLYKEDPTIMAWQLANEPRGYGQPKAYRKWVRKTAKYIKKIDDNHMVSIGSEGNTASHYAGNNFYKDHKTRFIDYTTMHIWIENWSWYNPRNGDQDLDSALFKAEDYLKKHMEISRKLKKPMVLEEFGVARDGGSFQTESTTLNRDRFLSELFGAIIQNAKDGNSIVGCNVWSWSGEGRPKAAGALWQKGDPLTGDPPHEKQGWYSIYNSDTNTLSILEEAAKEMDQLNNQSTISINENLK